MILIEENFDNVICEAKMEGDKKRTYLSGVFMEWGIKNRNQRTYSKEDIENAVNQINESAAANRHILCELDHPNTLEVKLENVSHRLMSAKLEGNKVICRAEVLENHPKGAILKSLLDHGVTVGVSSRGSGQVNESTGEVRNYRFVCVDAVATPSCRSAYPETIQEQLEMYRRGDIIQNLAEEVVNDKAAQKYFLEEMSRFIRHIRG